MLKDAGVLDGLVVALRHGEDHDAEVLAQVEIDGTHEVAHVLDEDDVDVLQPHGVVEGIDRLSDHIALEVAQAAGVNLDGRHTGLLHELGVHVACDVALDDGAGEAEGIAQAFIRGQDGGALARAGARKHVHYVRAGLREALAQLGGKALVPRENRLLKADGVLRHDPLLWMSWLGTGSIQPIPAFLLMKNENGLD